MLPINVRSTRHPINGTIMPKGRNTTQVQDTTLNYDSEASTISRNEDQKTLKAESNNESCSEAEHTEKLPMNEALAFTSMIDSNINGRLQDLFHDTSYRFTTSTNPQNVGSYHTAANRSSVDNGFQSDGLFGELKPPPHQQQEFKLHPYSRESISAPFPQLKRHRTGITTSHYNQDIFTSDTESSPELPKPSSFELNHDRNSAQSTPSNFNYNFPSSNQPAVFFSPQLKHEFDPNYSVSPSISENCSNESSTQSNYFQSQNSYKGNQSSISSNSNSATSSKPSYSASSNSSAPLSITEERSNSNDSLRSTSDSDSRSVSSSRKKNKKVQNLRGGTCKICEKVIRRDMSRHMRIHEEVSRFRCVYPRGNCAHKTGFFNRQYDFKKHLLHFHFEFDDGEVKKFYSLNEKLPHWGTCTCGVRFTGGDWLNNHVLTKDPQKLCSHLKRLKELESSSIVQSGNI